MSGDGRAESNRIFKEYLASTETAKYCCIKCTFRLGEGNVFQNPCKMGEDSGPLKEFCKSNPEKRYQPKDK